jgi:lysozyme
MSIKLLNVVKNFKGLPHQIEAIELLDKQLETNSPALILDNADWVKLWRSPMPIPISSNGKKTINQAGLELIKEFEGLVLDAYLCPADVWTIGYGHTANVQSGDRITQRQAEALLREDLAYFESEVERLVRVPLSDNQFSALVSFCYNIGSGALAESTLIILLNDGEYVGASQQFRRWTRGGGEELPGLVRRRVAEKALFDLG